MCSATVCLLEWLFVQLLTIACRHVKHFAPGVLTKCLYQFDDPVSPHIAARQHGVSYFWEAIIIMSKITLTPVDPPRR